MRRSPTSLIERTFGSGRKHRVFRTFVFAAVLLPAVAVMCVSFFWLHRDLTAKAFERRAVIAELAGRTVQDRLDGIVDLGRSLATRVAFAEHVGAGRWGQAITILQRVPWDFPYVERVFLADTAGTLKADAPRLAGVVGRDFSDRDWYRGVSQEWKPYVSEAYRREAEPQLHVIAVAVPIRDAATGAVTGILVLQMKLETLFGWISDAGDGGAVYLVDRNGSLMAHPSIDLSQELVDWSDVPAVAQALSVGTGVRISDNPVERQEQLTASWRSPRYGFIAVAYEPASTAFAARDRELRATLILYAVIAVLNLLLALILWQLIRALFRMHQKESAFLTNIGDGVIAVDRMWKIILWNPAASKLTGWTRDEAMGRPFRERVKFIRERDRKENLVFIEEAMLFGETRPMTNGTILLTRDGRELPVTDSAAPLFDEDGEVNGVIITFRDATREKDAAMLRTDFAYASHQLRTPVNKALWDLELAMDEAVSPIKERIRVAYDAVRDVQKLANRLIDVSKIDQKQVIPEYEDIRVAAVLKDVRETTRRLADERRVLVSARPVPADLTVDTDPVLLRTALLETVENAILYSVAGSGVEIEVLAEKSDLVFHVRDRGIGISDEQKPLVFTKFFRGQNVPQDAHGAGLGLFIAREYVRLLGGRMWFESRLGFGSTFTISIPRIRGMKE